MTHPVTESSLHTILITQTKKRKTTTTNTTTTNSSNDLQQEQTASNTLNSNNGGSGSVNMTTTITTNPFSCVEDIKTYIMHLLTFGPDNLTALQNVLPQGANLGHYYQYITQCCQRVLSTKEPYMKLSVLDCQKIVQRLQVFNYFKQVHYEQFMQHLPLYDVGTTQQKEEEKLPIWWTYESDFQFIKSIITYGFNFHYIFTQAVYFQDKLKDGIPKIALKKRLNQLIQFVATLFTTQSQ